MKKLAKRLALCALVTMLIWCGGIVADRDRLNEDLIRLHVVANSDKSEDQALKLAVRDAITENLQAALEKISDVESAKSYIQTNLPKLQALAQRTLHSLGCEDTVTVSLCRESFDTREYGTFSLPAGVYDALRIVIGDGEGKNWWCVVFPSLCIGTSSEEFEDTAAGAGFPESLRSALTGESECEIRFFLLDTLGELESRFCME